MSLGTSDLAMTITRFASCLERRESYIGIRAISGIRAIKKGGFWDLSRLPVDWVALVLLDRDWTRFVKRYKK